MKSYVDVLGTRYKIEIHKISEDSYLDENKFDGYCSEYQKLIVIADVNEEKFLPVRIRQREKTLKTRYLGTR